MNKQEIIQQFVQQMQEPSSEQYQKDLAALSGEIEALTKRVGTVLSTYDVQSIRNSCQFMEAEIKLLRTITQQLNTDLIQVKTGIKNQKINSLLQRYSTAILTGIFATLITNLIWQLIV